MWRSMFNCVHPMVNPFWAAEAAHVKIVKI